MRVDGYLHLPLELYERLGPGADPCLLFTSESEFVLVTNCCGRSNHYHLELVRRRLLTSETGALGVSQNLERQIRL